MAQFYLLSIFANVIAGLTLAGDFLGDRVAFLASFKNLRANRTAQAILGGVTLVVGVIKLFVGSPGELVPVAGDILPALMGIVLGGVLLVETFRPGSDAQAEKYAQVKKISKAVLSYRVPLGIAGVAVALVHFLLPSVVIL
jgi:hypothetical protein